LGELVETQERPREEEAVKILVTDNPDELNA